jgi:uncharacterized protein YcnI
MPLRRLTAVTALLLTLVAADAAFGHAVVRPAASRPAELQAYTLTVPTEKSAPTVSVSMQVPAGIDFFLVRPVAGWREKLERPNGRISVVRWTGGSIPRDSYEDFQFIARNPVREGSLPWKVVQRYADGSTVRWVGPPSSNEPAPSTRLSEQVVPEDVVDVESGKAPSSGAAAPSATDSGGKASSDDDNAAPIVAIAALVTALLALGAVVLGRRRKSA